MRENNRPAECCSWSGGRDDGEIANLLAQVADLTRQVESLQNSVDQKEWINSASIPRSASAGVE
jgi:hypothetical protein